jgi:hypothetical protein
MSCVVTNSNTLVAGQANWARLLWSKGGLSYHLHIIKSNQTFYVKFTFV